MNRSTPWLIRLRWWLCGVLLLGLAGGPARGAPRWQPSGPALEDPAAAVREALTQGRACQARFQREQAATAYGQALRLAPRNFEALWNLAVLKTQLAFGQADKARRQAGFEQARRLAEQALRLDSTRYEGHYAVALVAGASQRDMANPADRLAAGRAVRWHAGRALAYRPAHAESWVLLGGWHLGLANLSWAERLVAGHAAAGASNEQALHCFRQALRLQPDNLKVYLMAATACTHLHRPADAQALLHQALALPLLRPEDPQVRQKCTGLLREIG